MNDIMEKVEDLEIDERRRSGRKRRMSETLMVENLPNGYRDASAPPPAKKKLKFNSEQAVIKFYTNKNLGRVPRTDLETIYEEPAKDGANIGKRKVRRAITLERDFQKVTKTKKLMRQKKIKRLGVGQKKHKLTGQKLAEFKNLLS